MTFEEILRVTEKPRESWTREEENEVYWWYYHEIEKPSEEQILYFCENSMQWYQFLLETYPTEKNYQILCQRYGDNRSGRLGVKKALRKLLKQATTPSTELFGLIIEYGSKKSRHYARAKIYSMFEAMIQTEQV